MYGYISMKHLIINADDFGYSTQVNQAIIQAHQKGILTSTSLMVSADAFEEALTLAKANPNLPVGLHLVLGCGKSVLPYDQIPNLVDNENNFLDDPLKTGLRYHFNAKAREQLPLEIRAQLEKFRDTGLTLSHVDGHLHHHVNPVVLHTLLDLAEEFNIKYIRLPYEELSLTAKIAPQGLVGKTITAFVFSRLRFAHQKSLATKNIGFTDRVYGLLQTGNMNEDYLVNLIPQMSGDLVEIYAHPNLEGSGKIELEALLSPKLQAIIKSSAYQLTNFIDLSNEKP